MSLHASCFPNLCVIMCVSTLAGDGEATVLTYDARSQSLFVAGSYSFVAGLQCSSIAVWHRPSDTWTCLDTPDYSISTVTAMRLDPTPGHEALYLAGWASFQAQWQGRDWGSPYAISRIDVRGYIQHHVDLAAEVETDAEKRRRRGRGGRRHLVGQTSTPALRRHQPLPHPGDPNRYHVQSTANATKNLSRRLKAQNFQLKWDWLPGMSMN